jgi:dTDP-glucose 4,6-dehydratase
MRATHHHTDFRCEGDPVIQIEERALDDLLDGIDPDIPLMIRNALRHEPLPVYGDGQQVRDWLHVDDHCRAIELVLAQGQPGEVYNVGGDNERANLELVRLILTTLRAITGDAGMIDEGLIRHVKDRLGHDRRYGIDATKIRAQLGWAPRVSFEDGLARTLAWYLDHLTARAARAASAAPRG